jgi:hypothetical protein
MVCGGRGVGRAGLARLTCPWNPLFRIRIEGLPWIRTFRSPKLRFRAIRRFSHWRPTGPGPGSLAVPGVPGFYWSTLFLKEQLLEKVLFPSGPSPLAVSIEAADDSAGGSEQADAGVSHAWQRRKRRRNDNLDTAHCHTGHDPGDEDDL